MDTKETGAMQKATKVIYPKNTARTQTVSLLWRELRAHAPFTLAGTLTAVALLAFVAWMEVPQRISELLFWMLHPAHVLLSALVTVAMYRRHAGRGLWATLAVGYVGSVGIATVSDCLIPYVGEWLLGLPGAEPHIGFIEKWWLVNPLALLGIVLGWAVPRTKVPHAGHVLLSTWASLFHMTMATGGYGILTLGLVPVFVFLAVWLPCCTSDIVFPLLFVDPAASSDESAAPKE
jgi:hypothetical protein